MQARPLVLLTLLVFGILLAAGCSAPDTGLKKSAQSPALQTTSPALSLPDLALNRTDIPFSIVREYGSCQYPSEPPTGYTRRFLDNADESRATMIFTQEIKVFPAGEASRALSDITSFYLSLNKPPVSILRMEDPGIGDESVAFFGENSGQSPSRAYIIAFRKNDVIEIIEYRTAAPDYTGIKKAATAAAARIRPGRYTMPVQCPVGDTAAIAPAAIATSSFMATSTADSGVVRTGVQPAVPGISLTGPVQVAMSPSGSVGTISLGLIVTPGESPVDMTRMTYAVSTPAMLKNIPGTDPAVRLGWSPASAGSDTYLGKGESVTVTLDVSSMGISPSASGTRVDVEAKPAIGASLTGHCTVPAAAAAGSIYPCS